MKADARKEEYEHVELFGKPALLTWDRIQPDTVPRGWYKYELRGEAGDPITIEAKVGIDFEGTVLSPSEISIDPNKRYRGVTNQINYLGESMTLAEFCRVHDMECPSETSEYLPRPASPEEAGLFYAMTPEKNAELGCIGHVRMDFGHRGKEFWHTWWPRGPEELNSPAFKEELGKVVGALRETVLKDLGSMQHYCHDHGGQIPGGLCTQNHGYIVETENYRYCLRCNPIPGDYQAYLTCYDLAVQRQNMEQRREAQPTVGRLTFSNGEVMEFTDAKAYTERLKEELDCVGVTGFTFETLTDDPQVRKAVEDIICDQFGEENPRSLEEHQATAPTMQMGGRCQ